MISVRSMIYQIPTLFSKRAYSHSQTKSVFVHSLATQKKTIFAYALMMNTDDNLQ